MNSVEEQLAAFYQFNILNQNKEPLFDNLTKLAANICETKFAAINFIKSDFFFNKSSFGIEVGDIPRKGSFCEQVIEFDALLEINNTLNNQNLKDHPFVLNAPHVRFFSGIPLKLFNTVLIGTLSVFDIEEKKLSYLQQESLSLIAKQVETLIEMSLQKDTLQSLFEAYLNCTSDAMCIVGKNNYNILSYNQLFDATIQKIYGSPISKNNVIGDYFKGINFNNFQIGFAKAMNGNTVSVERLVTFYNFSCRYSMQYIPIRNSLNQIIAVGFTAKDITNEYKYKELLEETNNLASVGGWEFNFITNEFTWSSQTKIIFDLETDFEPKVNSILEFVNGEENKLKVRNSIEKTKLTGSDFLLELPIITAKNSEKWITLKGKGSFEGLKCVRIFGAVCDITKDKVLQLALIENKERFQGIVENTADIIYELDIEGKYVYVSPGIIKMTGYSPTELIDSNFTTNIHDEDIVKFESFIASLIHKGINEEVIEYRVKHKDGHYEWHESKCNIAKRMGRKYIFGIARNITLWKKAQEKLRELNSTLEKNAEKLIESEKRYSDLFLESPQPMWLYDLETLKFLQVNKAAIATYGYSQEEFLNMYVWQVRKKEQQEDSMKYHQQNLYTGTNYTVRRQHLTKSGSIIDVELYSNLVVINEKNYRLVIAVDITGNIKYMNAIESQNKKFKEIAWIQSHLVRHPLVNIMGLIPLIKRMPLDDLKTNEVLAYLEREANKLDEVISDIVNKAIEVEKQEKFAFDSND